MDSDTRTPDEIQRDIEQEREELSDTLNSLNETLSFDSISASISDQVRGIGTDVVSDFSGSLIERAREKPVAAGLILAGLAWMTLGTSERRAPRPADQDEPSNLSSDGADAPRFISERSQPQVSRAERVRSMNANRIKRLSTDAREMRTRIAEGTESLSEDARERVIRAREAAANAAEAAVDGLRAGAKKTKDVVQDNPFAIGGLALAIGAAIGGVMVLRKTEQDARAQRNELFRDADRILREETDLAAAPDPKNSNTHTTL